MRYITTFDQWNMEHMVFITHLQRKPKYYVKIWGIGKKYLPSTLKILHHFKHDEVDVHS